MRLQLSRDSPENTILFDDQGRPMYHITTSGFLERKTTVSRIRAINDRGDREGRKEVTPNTEGWQMGSESQEISTISWHNIRSSTMTYNGRTVIVNDFLHQKSFFRTARTFVGPDGKSYSWHTSNCKPQCYLEITDSRQSNANPTIRIAQFRSGSLFGRKAVLEIAEAGLHILDLIIITWIITERRRVSENSTT